MKFCGKCVSEVKRTKIYNFVNSPLLYKVKSMITDIIINNNTFYYQFVIICF